MTVEIELSLRGPQAFALAREALAVMEQRQIWPTPLNFELWVHYVGQPSGALGREMDRLLNAGEAITESVAEELATKFLPKAKLDKEIGDAGDQLHRQLESITKTIQAVQQSSANYGATLAGASNQLNRGPNEVALKTLVQDLSAATQTIQKHNNALERRLKSSSEEIVRLREHLETVRRESMTDALTNLANRKAFDDGLKAACAIAEKSGAPLTLAVIDIDHFKNFNDTWGHQTGDQVIRYVASVIGRMGKAPRLAARYGGEEFAIIFPNTTAAAITRELDAIRIEIGSRSLKRRSTNDNLGAVTVSMGVGQYGAGEAVANFLERADAALYTSKRTGRNRVTLADAPEQAPENLPKTAA